MLTLKLQAAGLCIWHVAGKCTKGSGCEYKHDELKTKGLNPADFVGYKPSGSHLQKKSQSQNPPLLPDPPTAADQKTASIARMQALQTPVATPAIACAGVVHPSPRVPPHPAWDKLQTDKYLKLQAAALLATPALLEPNKCVWSDWPFGKTCCKEA